MAGRKHGRKGLVKIDADAGSPTTLVTMADINAWTMDASKDRVDVTCFQDTNKIKVTGLPDFSGTIAGIYNAASWRVLFGVVLGDVAAVLRLFPCSDDMGEYLEGLANIDGSISVPASGAVTLSGKWDAAGNWGLSAI